MASNQPHFNTVPPGVAYSTQQQQTQYHQQQQPPPPGYQPTAYPTQPPPPPQQAQLTPPQQQQQQHPAVRPRKTKPRLEDQPIVVRTADEETQDGRLKNREAIAKIRETWIYKQVRARQDEFTNYRKVRTKQIL
jgi:hypothetical protein